MGGYFCQRHPGGVEQASHHREIVDHAIVPGMMDLDASLSQPGGIRFPFVPQRIKLGRNQGGGWQVA